MRTEWAWGVDVSSKRIAFGALAVSDREAPVTWSVDLNHLFRGAARLADCRERLRSMTRLVEPFAPPLPSAIVVENPANRIISFVLLTLTGVTMEVLFAEYECPTLELAVGKWKKEVLGHGHATKDAIMAHALELGGDPANQDEADALCVAESARARLLSALANA